MIGTYYSLCSQQVNKQVEQLHDNFYRAVAQACEMIGGEIITLN